MYGSFRVLILMAVATAAAAASASAQDYSHGRRLFLEKADCQYCHGWAGDGAGGGQSPGGAANLRKSQLDRATLITVIRCGIPGTAMPHFEEEAYSDQRCYGMTEAELGSRTPPLPPFDDAAAARHRGHCRLSARQGHRARAGYARGVLRDTGRARAFVQ